MWITKRLNQVLKDKIVVYKVTVLYDFVHYGYFIGGGGGQMISLEFLDIIY